MKTVLFVPGSGEDIDSRDYRSTMNAIRAKGYNVTFVPITWPRTTIKQWVQELEAEYGMHDPTETILAGFSFGAMTAFVTATHKNPSELWLFSLSSYFAEDFESKNQKKSWINGLGHRRIDAFKALNFQQLANKVQCKTLLFYGRKELDDWPIMNERAQGAHQHINNSKLIIVDGVGHDVADHLYISAITETI
jgi:pimeloyl-ACP methyl ester carboxylesterase